MMDLDIALTSDDGEFMVLYSDASNNNAMTATTAQVRPPDLCRTDLSAHNLVIIT